MKNKSYMYHLVKDCNIFYIIDEIFNENQRIAGTVAHIINPNNEDYVYGIGQGYGMIDICDILDSDYDLNELKERAMLEIL